MQTFIDLIKNDFDVTKNNFNELILNHSGIRYSPNPPGLFGFSEYRWIKLETSGVKLQSELYKKYNHLTELIEVLLSDVPKEYLTKFIQSKKSVFSYIEQNSQVWKGNTQAINDDGINELDKQLNLIKDIFQKEDSSYIFVPDTNALITNPEIEKWDFGVSSFEILLMPTVLSELDHLKISGRNENVRGKSNRLIKQIKEYRRRGRLSDGIPLVKNKSTFKTFAIEPEFSRTLPWLKEGNGDDRLLASFIEVLRHNPNDYVTLVTADINLQNKAEFANLPFIDVPEE